MPLALDLISTLVMGSILPVATTLFARSPFSTLASLEGSILVPVLDAITTPVTTRARTPAAIELQMMIRLRRFLLPLPLPSTTASCLIPNLRTVIHLLLREKRRNSSSKILGLRIRASRKRCRVRTARFVLPGSYQGIALAIPQVLRNPIPFRGWAPPAASLVSRPGTYLDRRPTKKKAISFG